LYRLIRQNYTKTRGHNNKLSPATNQSESDFAQPFPQVMQLVSKTKLQTTSRQVIVDATSMTLDR